MNRTQTIETIKNRILAEHRKHKALDWANIAAHKIWWEHFEILTIPFPRFWFEGNLAFFWINNVYDLYKVFEQYEGHMTPAEILDKSHNINIGKFHNTDKKYNNFGLRREHTGKTTLRQFLIQRNIIINTK